MGSSATVAGSGVAGLAAAVGLARLGWDVMVVERAPAPREDGAGLTLWPNAMRALDAIGVGDTVRDIGQPVVRAVVRRPSGAQIAELPIATLTSRYGPLVAVWRSAAEHARGRRRRHRLGGASGGGERGPPSVQRAVCRPRRRRHR